MSRVYNFSAGPSMLPEAVLRQAAAEMLDYQGSGQSVMEMSHRSKTYQGIIDSCSSLLREVLNVPENYEILFLQGGASSQFAMLPLNLATKSGSADFVITGQWAKKAFAECKKLAKAREVASSADKTFTYIPKLDPAAFDPNADYFHICWNNTIYGTRYTEIPETGSVPLVADMSSSILSEPVDVSRFGVIYAGAQKNMGPAGLTVVIIRKDLIGEPREGTPTMFTYKTHAENGSMYNTPPTYAIYICKLVLEWIKNDIGGLENMKAIKESRHALRLPGFLQALQGHRGEGVPFPDEHPLRHRQRGAGRQVRQRGCGRRVREPQGPPHRRRHAGFHLQRHAGGRRGEAGRLYEAV